LLWEVVKVDRRVLWYALWHRDSSRWPMAAIVLVALYAIAPFNVAIPFVGIMDEGVLIPSVLHLMGSAVCQARCYADVANGGIQTGNVT
jgi:uncharacterized membrane protein YkvA (DUF1232 family)